MTVVRSLPNPCASSGITQQEDVSPSGTCPRGEPNERDRYSAPVMLAAAHCLDVDPGQWSERLVTLNSANLFTGEDRQLTFDSLGDCFGGAAQGLSWGISHSVLLSGSASSWSYLANSEMIFATSSIAYARSSCRVMVAWTATDEVRPLDSV
jgi:hypothetical protein